MTGRRAELKAQHGPQCIWCGRTVWDQDLTLEHLLPRSRGGSSNAGNLLLACSSCNNQRKSQAIAAYARKKVDAGLAPRFDLIVDWLDQLADQGRRKEREYAAKQAAALRSYLTAQDKQRSLMQNFSPEAR